MYELLYGTLDITKKSVVDKKSKKPIQTNRGTYTLNRGTYITKKIKPRIIFSRDKYYKISIPGSNTATKQQKYISSQEAFMSRGISTSQTQYITESGESTEYNEYKEPTPPEPSFVYTTNEESYNIPSEEIPSAEELMKQAQEEIPQMTQQVKQTSKKAITGYFSLVNYLKDKYDIPRWLSYSLTVFVLYKIIKKIL